MLPLSFNSDCLKRADLNCARKPHLTTVVHFICPLKATGVVITRTRKQGSFKSLETRKSESCCYPTLFARYPGFVRDGKRTKHSRNDTDGCKPKYSDKKLCQNHFIHQRSHLADPGGCAFQGVGLRSFASWDCGFETRGRHGCPLRLYVVK